MKQSFDSQRHTSIRSDLDCGGKRSATPLSSPAERTATYRAFRSAGCQSGVAAALCHRSPNGRRSAWSLLLCLFVASTIYGAAPPDSISKLPATEQRARISGDQSAVLRHRAGLTNTLAYVRQRPDLFPEKRRLTASVLLREDKEVVWSTWKTFLDYTLALESTASFHRDFFLLKRPAQGESFLVRCAAQHAQYRWALAFIERAENEPGMDTFLNEPVPELGLPKDTYARLKLRFLNPARAADFAALAAYLRTVDDKLAPALRAAIRDDEAEILRQGRGTGHVLTVLNALQVIKQDGGSAWLPIQTGVAEWMGDTKVYRRNTSLISEAQALALPRRLLPGDVLLIRHEWYLSNIGLPGFWPHAALYIGTPEERRAAFGDGLADWLRTQDNARDFEAVLKARYPDAYAKSLLPMHNRPVRVLEAISEGVSFTSIEHAVDADTLVVLRPKVPLAEKATALVRAFHYAGRPYDFNFDFATDAELVCSELVYKAYEPATGFAGLRLPLVSVLGRKTLPPNEIVKQFDKQFGTPAQQFDFVLFLDGQERTRTAAESTVELFRASWKRPKWHIIAQDLPKLE